MAIDNIKKSNLLVLEMTGGSAHTRRTLTKGDIYKIRDVEIAVPIVSQPVCERCERICMWDSTVDMWNQIIPIAYCDSCGTTTKKPMTYGEYLANGHDIPSHLTGKEREDSLEARRLINLMFNEEGRDGNDLVCD